LNLAAYPVPAAVESMGGEYCIDMLEEIADS
jgi:hypothetical protein